MHRLDCNRLRHVLATLLIASSVSALTACTSVGGTTGDTWSGTWTGSVTYIRNTPLVATYEMTIVRSGDSVIGTVRTREYNPGNPASYDILTTAQISAIATSANSAAGSAICIDVEGTASGFALDDCTDIAYDRTTLTVQVTSTTTAIASLPDFAAIEPAVAAIPLVRQ